MSQIDAKKVIGDAPSVVDAAKRVGHASIAALEQGGEVNVSLQELNGLSSSFFNVLFLLVMDKLGADVLRNHFHLTFASTIQRDTADRSLKAVLASVEM